MRLKYLDHDFAAAIVHVFYVFTQRTNLIHDLHSKLLQTNKVLHTMDTMFYMFSNHKLKLLVHSHRATINKNVDLYNDDLANG